MHEEGPRMYILLSMMCLEKMELKAAITTVEVVEVILITSGDHEK